MIYRHMWIEGAGSPLTNLYEQIQEEAQEERAGDSGALGNY